MSAFPNADAISSTNGLPPYIEYSGALIHNPEWVDGINVAGYNRRDARTDIASLYDVKNGALPDARLLSVVARLDPLRMEIFMEQYSAWFRDVHLVRYIRENTLSNFSIAMSGLVLGPLEYDVYCIQNSRNRNHSDVALIEILLDRSIPDLLLLRTAYEARYRDLLAIIPLYLKPLFESALSCEAPADSIPINHAAVQTDVEEIHQALNTSKDSRMAAVGAILLKRSYPHRVALCAAYAEQHRKPLSKAVKDKLSGIQEDAVMHIVLGAEAANLPEFPSITGRELRDAELISDSMKGMGTKDELLIIRIIRAHWNRRNMDAVRNAYLAKHGKTLALRVKEDTSGTYRKLLVKLVEGE
ncbi:hypothetical protein C8J57DRAFT_1705781 [Mycena rebaudengoi]|nr:hypothetical protein C8J57DRAFT_1705781 [Mycena rebaudengoi]